MAEAKQQPKGRIQRWLDKRRESQRRGAEVAGRAKAARKADRTRRGATGTSGRATHLRL